MMPLNCSSLRVVSYNRPSISPTDIFCNSCSCCTANNINCGSSDRVRAVATRPRLAVVAGRVHPQVIVSQRHRRRQLHQRDPPKRPQRPLESVPAEHPHPLFRPPSIQFKHRSPKAARILGTIDHISEIGSSESGARKQCQRNLLPRPIIIVVRAYRSRKRRRNSRLTKRNLEANQRTVGWVEGDWDHHVRNGRLTKEYRNSRAPSSNLKTPTPAPQPQQRIEVMATVQRPEPPLLVPPYEQSSSPPWNARDLVGRGFQQARKTSSTEASVTNATVPVNHGYEINHAGDDDVSSHEAEISTANSISRHHTQSSSVSKLERITGTQLSNDLYENRVSGQPDGNKPSHSLARGEKSLSYPRISVPPLLVLSTNGSLSTSRGYGLSPTSSEDAIFTELAPPPPPIATAYPNIAALARANSAAEYRTPSVPTSSQTSSLSDSTSSQPGPVRNLVHIASQFNGSQNAPDDDDDAEGPAWPTLPSAASGGFTGLAREASVTAANTPASSISTFRVGMDDDELVPPLLPLLPPLQPSSSNRAFGRHSWSGRSVLFLDDTGEPPNTTNSRSTITGAFRSLPLRSSNVNQARVSAIGLSSLRAPPDGHLLRPSRSSISKASIASTSSGASSFESRVSVVGSGLSPAPAPAMRISTSRPQSYDRTSDDSAAGDRTTRSTFGSPNLGLARSPRSSCGGGSAEMDLATEMERIRERVNMVNDEFRCARASFGLN